MTEAGGVLATSVTVRGSKFELVTFPVGSTPPAWAQALITNPQAWATAPAFDEGVELPSGLSKVYNDTGQSEPVVGSQEDASPAPPEALTVDPSGLSPEEDLIGEAAAEDHDSVDAETGSLVEPPKRGAGSGRDAWATYARSKGVEVAPDTSRDDIIAAVGA